MCVSTYAPMSMISYLLMPADWVRGPACVWSRADPLPIQQRFTLMSLKWRT
jgi:hypothetical protein